MHRPVLGCLVFLFLATSEGRCQPIPEAELRAAAEKAMRPIQKSQAQWYDKAACTSCHHHTLPEITFAIARERGVAFDLAAARGFAAKSHAYLKDLDAQVQGVNYIDDIDDALRLVAAHAAGVKPNLSTDLIARFVASMQRPDGSWYTLDARPPQSHSRFTLTAICARAVDLYLPGELKADKERVLRRARAWFLKAEPRTTEDRVYQLLGLAWTGADEGARRQAGQLLLAEQRGDGGWAQISRLASDSYATGTALYALAAGGVMGTDEKPYQNGLRFLLKTQNADGSWRVETRMFPPGRGSPQYFDAGFPNGRYHQFMSIMGTSWAAAALMQAVPRKAGEKPESFELPDLSPATKDDWVQIVLNGTATDLKKALDAGMKASAKTEKGTSALMLAARDPAKGKLLLERGADVNARAESGVTALIVASRHGGNAESLRILLKAGAVVNNPKGATVANDASAIFFAATTGDKEMVRVLLDAGADIESRMLVLGQLPMTPLIAAVARGDTALAEYLIERGADVNRADRENNRPLDGAVTNNHPETLKLLLAKGAKVNYADRLGMTPLLYAASVDFGDTQVVELLLNAGAEVTAKDDEGRTALDLARLYKHGGIERVLKEKRNSRR